MRVFISAPASLPLMMKSPMWDTSNAPEWVLTAMCSSMIDVYWMGMSQPAKKTIFAPRAACWSRIGVLCMQAACGFLS